MNKKISWLGLIGILAFLPHLSHAITMEVRRISDNSVTGTVDFGSIATAARGLAGQYILVQYDPLEEEDLDTLKLFTDNENWQGGGSERGGLVRAQLYSERVPVFWRAFNAVQTGVVFDAQSVNTWEPLRDVNDVGFSNYDPSDVTLPIFPSGMTIVYFGADVALTNSAASYVANIKVKNGAVQGAATVYGQGFGPFNGVYRPSQDPTFSIPFGVKDGANVKIKVIDRQGKEVKTIVSGDYAPGNYTILWDGKDSNGERLGSGIYMLILQIGSDKTKKKLAIIN